MLKRSDFWRHGFLYRKLLDRVDLQKKWLLQRAWSEQYESWDSAKTIAGAVVPDGTTIVSKKAYLECLGKIPANRFF
jgi:hypothetical protein